MASSGEIEKLERRWAENQLGLTFAPLAEAYRKAGDPARALQLLQVGMVQHPNYVPAHIVRGRCHLDTQSDGEAELSFLRVTELDPENVIALKSLAEISERTGRLPEAIRRLETLLDIDRNNEEAQGQLDRVREVLASLAGGIAVAGAVAAVPAVESAAPVEAPAESFAETLGFDAVMPEAPVDGAASPMAPIDVEPIEEAASAVEETVAPVPSEFQLPSDAESLLPTDDRLDDIIIAEETHLEVREEVEPEPVPEAELVAAAPEPEPGPEPEFGPVPEPEPVTSAAEPPASPVVLEVPVSIVEVTSPPPYRAEPVEPEAPAPVETSRSAPEPEPEPEPAEVSEPELVVTETMAEIFLRQGHRELALAVYTQLAQRDPWNDRVKSAAAALQQELAPPPPPPAPEPPAPRYAASETGGRSVQVLFGALLAARRPAVPTAIHPPAFEGPRAAAGEPTRPAQDALSLSAVFGDEAAPAGPASPPPAEPSFDEFFAGGSSADSELPKPPGQESAATASQAPEDLEQFNAWLRGLKR